MVFLTEGVGPADRTDKSPYAVGIWPFADPLRIVCNLVQPAMNGTNTVGALWRSHSLFSRAVVATPRVQFRCQNSVMPASTISPAWIAAWSGWSAWATPIVASDWLASDRSAGLTPPGSSGPNLVSSAPAASPSCRFGGTSLGRRRWLTRFPPDTVKVSEDKVLPLPAVPRPAAPSE